jgi:adenylate kinase family enzyme
MLGRVRRVSVVGSSGSGKTTLGRRLAEQLDVPFFELDAIHHLANWEPIDPQEFDRRLDEVSSGHAWVIDGDDSAAVAGSVWRRADTIVWIDLPRWIVMRQVVGRTVGRIARRAELWNGNRESARSLFRWDPDHSIVRWAWTTHGAVQERYRRLLVDSENEFDVVRLRSRAEIDEWLSAVTSA